MLSRKILIIGICILFLFIVGTLFFASDYFFKYALLSKQYSDTKPALAAANWYEQRGAEKLNIKSGDGLDLTGYFYPAEKKTDRLVILAHGYGGKADGMSSFAEYYHSEGFHVFAPDDRAHGASEGKYIGMGWLDRKDYIKWINVLIEKLGANIEIVLHGESMGGAAVMMLSGEKLPSNVKCIIEDCGYTSVKDEFKHQLKEQFNLPEFPLLGLASLQTKLRAGYSYAEASSLEQIKKSTIPIFFIHGDADTYVPTDMVYKLYDAAKCEKELWIVPGAAHAESYNVAKKEYQQRINDFYCKYLNESKINDPTAIDNAFFF